MRTAIVLCATLTTLALVTDEISAQTTNQQPEQPQMPPPASAVAEQDPPSSGGIFLNPLGFLLGSFNGELGIGVSDSLSLNLGLSYYSVSNTTGFGLNAGLQIFPFAPVYDGFFVYPLVLFATAETEIDGYYESSSAEATLGGIGALLGYQWDWHPFSLRLGGGAALFTVVAESGDAEVALEGILPMLDASIGFTW